MIINILLNIAIEGFHYYPDAPEEVSFLANPHRHIFNITAKIQVNDLNREQEIILSERFLKNYLYAKFGNPCQFNKMSCEMIAVDILNQFKNKGYNYVKVLEDNGGGAEVYL
jgi:hypothetical protein